MADRIHQRPLVGLQSVHTSVHVVSTSQIVFTKQKEND